jgi:hypothetical protein
MRYYETKTYKACFHHSGETHCACNGQLELYISRNWDLKQKLNGLYNLTTSLIHSLEMKVDGKDFPFNEKRREIGIDLRNLKWGLRDLRNAEKEDWRDFNRW